MGSWVRGVVGTALVRAWRIGRSGWKPALVVLGGRYQTEQLQQLRRDLGGLDAGVSCMFVG